MKKLSVAIIPVLLSVACGEKSQTASRVDSSVSSAHGAVPATTAPAQAGSASPVASQPITPELTEACDTAQSVMRTVLAVSPKREDGSYQDSFSGEHRVGCRLTATVVEKVAQGTPAQGESAPPGIPERLEERGWAQDLRYMSDGPDGGAVGLRRRALLCLVRTEGPHEDDDDTTSVRSAADTVDYVVECAHDVSSNNDGSVPDSVWSVARAQGLDSVYAIDFRLQYPPYLEGDFDADGKPDAAVLVNERATGKLGLAFVLRGAQRVIVVGAGKPIGDRDDFAGLKGWEKFLRGFSMAAQVPFIPSGPLAADGVWLRFADSTSGFVEWNGAGYTWDIGKRIK